MVVMSVSYDYGFNILLSFFQIADVGDDIINARSFFFGKLKSHINYDYFIAILKKCHIAADFFQAAQSGPAQRLFAAFLFF